MIRSSCLNKGKISYLSARNPSIIKSRHSVKYIKIDSKISIEKNLRILQSNGFESNLVETLNIITAIISDKKYHMFISFVGNIVSTRLGIIIKGIIPNK